MDISLSRELKSFLSQKSPPLSHKKNPVDASLSCCTMHSGLKRPRMRIKGLITLIFTVWNMTCTCLAQSISAPEIQKLKNKQTKNILKKSVFTCNGAC